MSALKIGNQKGRLPMPDLDEPMAAGPEFRAWNAAYTRYLRGGGSWRWLWHGCEGCGGPMMRSPADVRRVMCWRCRRSTEDCDDACRRMVPIAIGRKAIGIEIEERHCEMAAKRLSQETLGLSA